jgi:uncharacterized protein (TIGR02996 family)
MSTFARLRYDRAPTYARLERALACWAEAHGDPRGEFMRLQHDLAELRGQGRWPSPPTPGSDASPLADALLREIAEQPGDETPWLVLGDWLEERGDPGAVAVRLEARVRALSRALEPAWIEFYPAPLGQVPAPFSYAQFTDHARRVVQVANQEAQRFNHEYICTQHVLLALLREDFGGASDALRALGVLQVRAVQVIERLSPPAPDLLCASKLPQTARTRAIILAALDEAATLGHDRVVPEHLLLGLCRAAPCVATQALQEMSAPPRLAGERMAARLGHDPQAWVWGHPETW